VGARHDGFLQEGCFAWVRTSQKKAEQYLTPRSCFRDDECLFSRSCALLTGGTESSRGHVAEDDESVRARYDALMIAHHYLKSSRLVSE
jgi:hypothetical protein